MGCCSSTEYTRSQYLKMEKIQTEQAKKARGADDDEDKDAYFYNFKVVQLQREDSGLQKANELEQSRKVLLKSVRMLEFYSKVGNSKKN